MTGVRRAAQWGTWVISGVLLLVLYRTDALAGGTLRHAAYLASIGAWCATAWLLAWPAHHPERLRQTLAAALGAITLAATVAVTLSVPAAAQHTNANWAVGVNGWLLLTIASGGRLSVLLLCLTVPVAFATAASFPAGQVETVMMTARALGILGLQVPIALAAREVERSAAAASTLHLTREAIRTDQIVAAALHDDRLRRSRAIAAAVAPVLASLAGTGPLRGDGPHGEFPGAEPGADRLRGAGPRGGFRDAEPGADGLRGAGPRGAEVHGDGLLDDTVRQRSRVAAAQVRRLLAEWQHVGGDPLGGDLSAALDDLQAAGTPVEVAVHVEDLPPALRQATRDVVRAIARHPVSRLRLTAVPTATELCVSVVARTHEDVVWNGVSAPVAIRTTVIGETLWVELTCPK
ncbi:hypothetical protein [Catenuloplanes japonicus]|uniref:hypothetical protein n=1 Tax=Catenuloplanes japonicus TaxID=33876 RepID=UPI000527EA44|nr:hypothetical protein [Catenuloplanes japonicus]